MTAPTEQERVEAMTQTYNRYLYKALFCPSTPALSDDERTDDLIRMLILLDPLTAHAAQLEADKRELVNCLKLRNTHEYYCPVVSPPSYGLCTCGLDLTATLIAKHRDAS